MGESLVDLLGVGDGGEAVELAGDADRGDVERSRARERSFIRDIEIEHPVRARWRQSSAMRSDELDVLVRACGREGDVGDDRAGDGERDRADRSGGREDRVGELSLRGAERTGEGPDHGGLRVEVFEAGGDERGAADALGD